MAGAGFRAVEAIIIKFRVESLGKENNAKRKGESRMKETGRLLAMGDIHGHYDKMLQVLKLAKYEPEKDQLIFLGDYVDRGPHSKPVLTEVMRLVSQGAVALFGNHEDMMLRALKNRHTGRLSEEDLEQWYANGGERTLDEYRSDSAGLDDHLAFLASLSRWHEEKGFLFVHAGIRPGLPVRRQSPQDLIWVRDSYILGYSGPQEVVAGHTPTNYLGRFSLFSDIVDFSRPIIRDHKFFLDTGAAWNGPLTLMEVLTKEYWQV